jgi:hypothetical protein
MEPPVGLDLRDSLDLDEELRPAQRGERHLEPSATPACAQRGPNGRGVLLTTHVDANIGEA